MCICLHILHACTYIHVDTKQPEHHMRQAKRHEMHRHMDMNAYVCTRINQHIHTMKHNYTIYISPSPRIFRRTIFNTRRGISIQHLQMPFSEATAWVPLRTTIFCKSCPTRTPCESVFRLCIASPRPTWSTQTTSPRRSASPLAVSCNMTSTRLSSLRRGSTHLGTPRLTLPGSLELTRTCSGLATWRLLRRSSP